MDLAGWPWRLGAKCHDRLIMEKTDPPSTVITIVVFVQAVMRKR